MVKKFIEKSIENNFSHVFLVVNPLNVIVTKLIIDQFGLKSNEVLIVTFRNVKTSLLDYKTIHTKNRKFDGIMRKIFFLNPNAKTILNNIDDKFILYASWAFREVNYLLKSSKCGGHIYIEEGQGSYINNEKFDYSKLSLYTKIKNHFKNRINNEKGPKYTFRSDTNGFIALYPESFPSIEAKNKFFLKNFKSLKKIYKPRTIGIKNIALTCAERRLLNNDWEAMLLKLIKTLPNGGLIKLHPSFFVSEEKIDKIKFFLAHKTNDLVKLCSNDIILELEMLFEKKTFYGPQTSLLFYAKHFGSNFVSINLY